MFLTALFVFYLIVKFFALRFLDNAFLGTKKVPDKCLTADYICGTIENALLWYGRLNDPI